MGARFDHKRGEASQTADKNQGSDRGRNYIALHVLDWQKSLG